MPDTTTVRWPDDDLTDEELERAARAGMGHPKDDGYCEVCHHELQTGDLCPTCERADEGLR